MLTGKRAFRGATHADTISAILKEEQGNLWELNPNAPPATAHIIRHCLEKRPEDRFQTARDLLFDLSTLSSLTGAPSVPSRRGEGLSNRPLLWGALAGVLLLAVLATVFFLWKARGKAPPFYPAVFLCPVPDL